MKYCSKCGCSMEDNSAFCPSCGTKCQSPADASVAVSSSSSLSHETSQEAPREMPREIPQENGKKKKKFPVVIAAALILVLLGGGGFVLYRMISDQNLQRLQEEMLTEGSDYLEEGDYKKAEKHYQDMLDVFPKDESASIGLAKAYCFQGKYSKAIKELEDMEEVSPENEELYSRLLSIARFQPQIGQVDTDNFPLVTVSFSCQGELQLAEDMIKVMEDGAEYELQALQQDGQSIVLSYLAPDTDVSDEGRSLSVEFQIEDFTMEQSADYKTPYFRAAAIQLVSTDVSQYPLVKAYFRVEETDTENAVEGLSVKSFFIRERIEGGEYLSREIHSAASLSEAEGINIDLVADKSGSISYSDMQKIQNVMTQFVLNLNYELGDKAEVLAFDSIVQQMCYYTDDSALLVNGISNMSPEGGTALYNALHDGISNAALQGGARCVIAFTDGDDNMSIYSPNEIIQYACDCQVPVYIIGVGYYLDTDTLQTVAERTGGKYWNIDDLYDLQEIYNEIYQRNKKLYVVEYVSDENIDPYTARFLNVGISGEGYRADKEVSFTASRSVGAVTHTSRYELFKEALTWEEAARRCQEMGGHLATITSQSEMDQIIAMAEAEDVRYMWLGGYTSYDRYNNVFGHWVTGEEFSFQAWSKDEPSRRDLDGTEEWYIMLWNIPSLGGWSWNDQRNDPLSVASGMAQYMGYVCEYEN